MDSRTGASSQGFTKNSGCQSRSKGRVNRPVNKGDRFRDDRQMAQARTRAGRSDRRASPRQTEEGSQSGYGLDEPVAEGVQTAAS